jgi:mono/diheme cytochrome c family protein
LGGWFAAYASIHQLPSDSAGPYGGYLALYHANQGTADPPDGARLFAHHCAHCHGANADGNGTTPLSPKARYIGGEGFKFTNTLSGAQKPRDDAQTLGGVPTDDQLIELLRRGVTGSPMPSFAQLPAEELRAIVEYVRLQFVTPERVLDRFKTVEKNKVTKSGEEWSEASDWSAEKQKVYLEPARAEVFASTPIPVPTPFPPPTDGYQARGRKIFETAGCVGCHGPNGKGTIDPNRRNDNGTQAYPRDLTAGVYKGGSDFDHLYRRIYLGIPGTPMKAHKDVIKNEQDLFDLIHYVRSLPEDEVAAVGAANHVVSK